MLLHLVDGTLEDVAAAYRTVRAELEEYGHGVADKRQVVALNKCDALGEDDIDARTRALRAITDAPVIALSAVTGAGREAVLDALAAIIAETRAVEAPSSPAPAPAWQP